MDFLQPLLKAARPKYCYRVFCCSYVDFHEKQCNTRLPDDDDDNNMALYPV